MQLDRQIQRALLEALQSTFPAGRSTKELIQAVGIDENSANGQLRYLEGHGLIEAKWVHPLNPPGPVAVQAAITHKGLDFLADDGGLSAILGVTVVKLHEQTLRDLIAARIESAPLDQPDKKKLLDRLRELPAESIKHLTMKLLDLALDKAPGAFQLLANMLGMN
jgi:DNA-binding Lrp family transcriptional regulator